MARNNEADSVADRVRADAMASKAILKTHGFHVYSSCITKLSLRVQRTQIGVYMVSILGIVVLVLGIYSVFGYLDP